VNPLLFMIVDVITDQAAQVPLMQCDEVIEPLAAATSDPSFRGSVLPRRLHVRSFRPQPGCLRESDNVGAEDLIAVQIT